MKEIFLIGLGNPGKKYSNSRHNVGFLLLKKFSKKNNSNFLLKDKLKSSCSEFNINNSSFRLFLPNTFMNNSGDAVRAIVDWYKVNLDQVFIIVDDKDLPLGKIRFRKKGSSGGHNGLKSIIEQLQTQNFKRIRIGIGSPPFIRGGDPIPILILLKFCVCNCSMMLLSPLCPPELPFLLNLIFPRGRSLSSTIMKI